MTKIDDITYILKDKSIINFYDDGSVEFFSDEKSDWKQTGKKQSKYGFGKSQHFKYDTKEKALIIWQEINRLNEPGTPKKD